MNDYQAMARALNDASFLLRNAADTIASLSAPSEVEAGEFAQCQNVTLKNDGCPVCMDGPCKLPLAKEVARLRMLLPPSKEVAEALADTAYVESWSANAFFARSTSQIAESERDLDESMDARLSARLAAEAAEDALIIDEPDEPAFPSAEAARDELRNDVTEAEVDAALEAQKEEASCQPRAAMRAALANFAAGRAMPPALTATE